MGETIMTLSYMERRIVQEVRLAGQKLYWANQDCQGTHILSAALAYWRSLAASALEKDPYDITWKEIAFVTKEVHRDLIILGG